jgi:hypothetical protein
MAKSNAPKNQPVDLRRSVIPGGTATWFTRKELSPRRSRELSVYEIKLMPRLRELAIAQKIIGPNGETLANDPGLPGIPTGISMEESREMLEMNDTAAWAFLKGWSLKRNGEPVPLPETPDDVLDLPPALYQALIEHAAKITTSEVSAPQSGFEFNDESFEDEDSPTLAFDA